MSPIRDGKTKIITTCLCFERIWAEMKIGQKCCFLGKRHDNLILNVQILSSRNFVFIAQAPILKLGCLEKG